MVVFFKKGKSAFYAVETDHVFDTMEIERLTWLLDGAKHLASRNLKGRFIGPRKEMITPWITNAVEITQNMGLSGISRIEAFVRIDDDASDSHDPMLQRLYNGLSASIFDLPAKPVPIVYIDDIAEYNKSEGLALSPD